MTTALTDVIGFEGFVLEPGRGRLIGPGGVEIALRPKAFDLLVVLAREAGTPLSKEVLLDRIWGSVHVTEDSLFQAVREARRAICDRDGKMLRHIVRRGYLLDCPITTSQSAGPRSASPVTQPEPRTERPSIAVLPFKLRGDPGSDHLAAGLVDEVTTALSRFRWLIVTANASSMQIDTGAEPPAVIGRTLGVRYLVDGSLDRNGARLVVRCRLIEAPSSRQVWQQRFEADLADILSLYDAMTSAIAAALEPRLLRAEIERVLRNGTSDFDAFDCYLRALPGYYSRTPKGTAEAIAFLESALQRDPHFALARALLARCVATNVWLGVEQDHAAGVAKALALAREALALDRSDPQILALCGHLLAIIGGEHVEANALLDLSLNINPNGAEAWRLGGWVSSWGGETDLALDRLAEAERLDPLSPLQSDVHSARSVALFFGRRFTEAVVSARRSIATTPEATAPRRFLVAALWHLGRIHEAIDERAALVALQPNSSLRRSRAISLFRHSWMTDMFLDGLRGAGLPE